MPFGTCFSPCTKSWGVFKRSWKRTVPHHAVLLHCAYVYQGGTLCERFCGKCTKAYVWGTHSWFSTLCTWLLWLCATRWISMGHGTGLGAHRGMVPVRFGTLWTTSGIGLPWYASRPVRQGYGLALGALKRPSGEVRYGYSTDTARFKGALERTLTYGCDVHVYMYVGIIFSSFIHLLIYSLFIHRLHIFYYLLILVNRMQTDFFFE